MTESEIKAAMELKRKNNDFEKVLKQIPEKLRRKFRRAASKNERTVYEELVHRLEQSFETQLGRRKSSHR